MNFGDTFYIRQRDTLFDGHLWFVISDPFVNAAEVVTVNCTTWNANKDQACCIEGGEHQRVTHKSCIEFSQAKVIRADFFDRCVAGGLIILHAGASDDLLYRIIDGAAASDFTPTGVVKILVDQGLVDGE